MAWCGAQHVIDAVDHPRDRVRQGAGIAQLHKCRNPCSPFVPPYNSQSSSLVGSRRFDSLLIHSACGDVGLAAIQIARMSGAGTYAMVRSEETVQYLIRNCNIVPGIRSSTLATLQLGRGRAVARDGPLVW